MDRKLSYEYLAKVHWNKPGNKVFYRGGEDVYYFKGAGFKFKKYKAKVLTDNVMDDLQISRKVWIQLESGEKKYVFTKSLSKVLENEAEIKNIMDLPGERRESKWLGKSFEQRKKWAIRKRNASKRIAELKRTGGW